MPVVSPGRFPSSSASSISSSPFRSTSSYYSSATGTYIAPRPTHRSNFSDRSSSSVSDYRTHSRFTSYDSDGVRERKSSYASDYRCVRAPSISDSDSGISNMSRFTNRSERSTSRSRDTSVARSDSARTTRSESTSNSILSMSTADMFLKYSPDNYIPAVQRLSSAAAATNGDSLRSGKSYSRDATRLPPPRRTTRNTEDDEVKQRSKSDTNNTPRPMKRQTNSTVVKQCVHSHKSVECVTNNSGQQADPLKRDVECAQRNRTARTTVAAITKSRPWFDRKTESCRDTTLLSDDNGNDLQVSVAEIRRKFDNKMPVTRLPAHEPFSSSHYKTTRSSDNIYKQTNNLNNGVSSFSEDKPVPVHRPTTSDKYANGTTGSLKWEFSSPSSSSGYDSKESGYSIKRSTEPGSDISTIYIACKSNGSTSDTNPVNSVKSQLNSNANAKILEKSTTVYVGNGDVKVNGTTNHKTNSTNVLNIEIGNSSKSTEKQSPPKKTAVTISNHTSDFASYIQMSAPVKNNSSSDNDSKDAELNNGPASPKNANGEETDASKLRFIDSEPNSESDSRQTIECNGKTNHNDAHDDEEQENGFENKTFEHENGRLLMRKRVEENVGRLPNGLGSRGSEDSDSSDCEPKEELESVKASNSEGDALNRNVSILTTI